jgi:hypothetical protein
MSNPFEHWAEQEKPKWQERQERRERLRKAKLAAVMEEKRQLEQRYQAIKQEDRDKQLAGAYASELQELLDFLETLTLASGPELVELIKTRAWLKDANQELRFQALHLIDGAIISLRESQRLPPFDDPIFDQPLNVFLKLRELLR